MSIAASFIARRFWCVVASALALFGAGVAAQEFPNKSITIVVPYPPGSATDLVARLLGPKITESTKQSVIVKTAAARAQTSAPATSLALLRMATPS